MKIIRYLHHYLGNIWINYNPYKHISLTHQYQDLKYKSKHEKSEAIIFFKKNISYKFIFYWYYLFFKIQKLTLMYHLILKECKCIFKIEPWKKSFLFKFVKDYFVYCKIYSGKIFKTKLVKDRYNQHNN